ncbi:MAG: DUF92 domain-containing protein [Chloroflexi bacterium]|nr:DUF92 domain-containing protein [Chloroflexota bacterium]
MPISIGQLAAGFALSALIGLIAYRFHALSLDGVAGAVLVGTLTFGLGGFSWAAVIVAFFASSSLLTRYGADQKRGAAAEFAKGGRRDFFQVMANGGAAAALAVASALFPALNSGLIFAAFIGAMATVTADTWATELGLLSQETPRLITTWKSVRKGESGAVTVLGLTAAATGALFIGSAALFGKFLEGLFTDVFANSLLWLPSTALIAGWLGSLGDSVLGATVQAMYYCAPDDQHTERPVHLCGRAAIHTRGLRWMTNDMVNFLSSVAGAVLGGSIYLLLSR